jgi:hypothetical protein
VRPLALALLLVVAGCVVGPRELEGFACEADDQCLFELGYRCVDEVCVFDPVDLDGGPAPDAGD